ncbi:capsular polysaccharide transport system ATP-binding protein [Rhizobium sp. SG_E_25_P2]|jgi:capsular polysaccharide transport system ATP-binding protein|uniref:ATP-binding cassette domain-containing protein n=1 Tax=Rhizobium sp. SG_E_25_P2 TaxID=2879942 RepID=UPI00247422F1|nr:ATP-binding cassette domain-containing protein [Rhizobium sp. SG_E_25_P2]MDH6269118.1 capsular polysaccharide transport system ATP-binding protein [Rhizobium sp. SG_E_25_P2]
MITLENAGKAYRDRRNGIQWVFQNLNAVFHDGDNHAVLAPRGQGKTTLLNVICGNDTLSQGEIHRRGRVSYPMDFRANISQKLTGRQNLRFLTDIYGRNYPEALDFCAAFSAMDRQLDLPLKNIQNQARARFAVSALLSLGFNHILIDDTISLGDQKFRRKCMNYIIDNSDKFTVLLATSDPDYAAKMCKSASVLHQGKLTFFDDLNDAAKAFNEINKVYV